MPNSVLRVLSDAMSGLCHLTLQYLDWLARQLLPDTAEHEWLDRHGHLWLTNADGSTGRKLATLASGTVTVSGTTPFVRIPSGIRIEHRGISYETTEEIFLASGGAATPVSVIALDPGAAGNVPPETRMTVTTGFPGLNPTAIVVRMTGGVDEETDDQLRYRVLLRIREPPQGGSKVDYEQWALAVPGVTRAWTAPQEMGIGTVTVRFMADDLRAAQQGFPQDEDLIAVRDYLDRVRPVSVKDLFVVAPIPQRINMIITNLIPDTPAVRAGIEESLKRMIQARAAPGQTIYGPWKICAILDAPGVVSFSMASTDDFMESPGHMAVLGSVMMFGATGQQRTVEGAAVQASTSIAPAGAVAIGGASVSSHEIEHAVDQSISAHLHETQRR